MNDQLRLFDFAERKEGEGAFIVADSNRAAIGLLEQWRVWPGGALALVGPIGAGKSHLAKLWAAQSGALFLPAKTNSASAREAFLARDGRLVIDDADGPHDDAALLVLLDLARTEGGAVLLIGQTAPSAWPAGLPDLRSRFAALLTASLGEPEETLLAELLRRLCRARFIELRENVAKYLAQNMERSFGAARLLVNEIDRLMVDGSHPVPYDVAAEALRRVEGAERDKEYPREQA
jgi:chromosomal replication initiation ATPase DnaA